MKKFLEATAIIWKEKPKSYGLVHLSIVILGVILLLLVALILRKKSEKTIKWILFGVSVFLILIEIYKLLFNYFVVYGYFNWYLFPFQLCSVPMYIGLVLPFIKNKTVLKGIYNFLLAFTVGTAFSTLLEPSGLIYGYVTLTLHAFVWHLLILFMGVLVGVARLGAKKLEDFVGAVLVFAVLAIIATGFNIAFKDFGNVNMFYISPYKTTPIVVFDTIHVKFGFLLSAFLYILAMCILAFVFYLIWWAINREKREKVYYLIEE